MIKYIGSKRRLARSIGALASGCGATTAADLFTGTTRVAQELKRRGSFVTAVDTATYSRCSPSATSPTDATIGGQTPSSTEAPSRARPPSRGRRGYFTEVFCERARYLRPENGARVNTIRQSMEPMFTPTARSTRYC